MKVFNANRRIYSGILATIFATSIHAAEVKLPTCLANKITWSHTILAEDAHYKIISLSDKSLSSLTHLADTVKCGRFVNVTHVLANKKTSAQSLLIQKPKKLNADKYVIAHQPEVEAALKLVDSSNINATLTSLTSFYNRSATKQTGVDTADWIKAQFDGMASRLGREDVASYFVKTGSYKQPSLVTVIGKDLKGEAIVIGAHMDTLDGRMPGAGDDGSGSSSVMEMARVILASKLEQKRPIYFMWYAAEERGLVGSQYVVSYFKKHNIAVKAAIQFDMTGYRNSPDDATMWVYEDYTDKALSAFVAKLITTYVKAPVDYSECGYGCSDHASWDEVGVPAAFPCETNFEDHNPYIHTSDDTMSLLSLDHMTNFSKLGLAFAIELGLS